MRTQAKDSSYVFGMTEVGGRNDNKGGIINTLL